MIFRLAIFLFVLSAAARAGDVAIEVLEEINLARTQPAHYAEVIARRAENFRGSEGPRAAMEAVAFLKRARPLPPLAWSRGISQAALSHALDVGPRGGHGHSGTFGGSPWKRMARFGTWSGHAGENIDYGHADARAIVISLIIDNGVRSRAHRANLFSRNFLVAGIAVAPHANWGTMCVMDFASAYREGGDRVAVRTPGGPGLRSEYSGMSFF